MILSRFFLYSLGAWKWHWALTIFSGYWRICQLCCVRFCAGYIGYTFGSVERIDRVSYLILRSQTRRENMANWEDCRAVLGTYFLNEKLGILGKIGCAICLIGSVIILLHAPPDEEVETIDVLLHYAMRPGTSSHPTVYAKVED